MPLQPRRLPRAARPDRIAAEYLAALGPSVRVLQTLLAELIQDLAREWPQPEPVRTDNDRDVARAVKRTADKLARAIKAESIVPIATKYGAATSDFQRAQLAKQARAAVSIDVRKLSGLDRNVPRHIAGFAQTHADLITGLGQRLADDIGPVEFRIHNPARHARKKKKRNKNRM